MAFLIGLLEILLIIEGFHTPLSEHALAEAPQGTFSSNSSSGLTASEQATISVFKKASRSVVYITNKAIRRDFWSLNTFEVPQGSGSGFIWDSDGHIVTNFPCRLRRRRHSSGSGRSILL